MKISVVVPVLNEAESIQELCRRIRGALRNVPCDYEVIIVDDASSDQTWNLIEAVHRTDTRVKGIRLARHAGHQIAVWTGFKMASGDAVITLDGDLQHPPELIPELIDGWNQSYDLVFGVKTEQAGRSRAKKVLNHVFHSLFSAISKVRLRSETSDFQILDRTLVQKVLQNWQPAYFLRGWIHLQALKRKEIPFSAAARIHGESRQRLLYLIRLGFAALLLFPRQNSAASPKKNTGDIFSPHKILKTIGFPPPEKASHAVL